MTAVVTGLGLVTACGLGPAPLLAALARGLPHRSPLPFPSAGFPRQAGGCAPPRSELAALLTRRKDLKLMTQDTLLAVAAGVLAWRDAGLEDHCPCSTEEVGLFLGVGAEKGEISDLSAGVAVSTEEGRFSARRLAERGLDRINPVDSLKTLPNMALAHLAIRLELRGPALTFCGSPAASLHALAAAQASLARGECRLALVGGTDCLVSLAGFVLAWRLGQFEEPATFPGEAAAICVLEPEEQARSRRIASYAAGPALSVPELEAVIGRCGVASQAVAYVAAQARAGRAAGLAGSGAA